MTAVDLFCRALLVVVFAVAATGKVSSRGTFNGGTFNDLVDQLRPLLSGTTAARIAAVGLTVAECVAAVLLVTAPATGHLVGIVTMMSLTAGVWVILRRGLRVECRCFGRKSSTLNRGHLLRNSILVVIGVTGLVSHLLADTTGPPTGVTLSAAGGGAALGLGLTRWDDLTYLLTVSEPRDPATRVT